MNDDELIARLRKADEYEPLGHDGWEAADRIEQLLQSNARLEALLTRAAEGGVDVSGSAIIYGYPLAVELHKDLRATLTQKDRTDG